MNGTPPKFSPPVGGQLPGSGRADFGQATASTMSMKWSALHDAGDLLASLAGLSPEGMRPELRNFPAAIRDAGGWRRSLAEQGVNDLVAMIEPGIAALLAANARGAHPATAALALWQEFQFARTAMLALVPATGPAAARRFA